MAEPTRLKIIAQIEGIQGFDALKRSLQGMAQQSQQSGMSLDRLYIATRKLSEQGRNSISSLRLQATALSQLREQAELGSRRFKMLTSDLERVEAQLRRTTQASRAGGGGLAAAGAAGLIGQFAPQLAVGAAVTGVATAGVSAESAEVRLKALTDQFGEYNEAQAAAARIASTLRMNTAEATDSFSQLYASLRPTGITVRELEDTLIGFAAAARNSGASAQETSAAMIQLKQALASGVLQGEELRSIREQAPLAAQAIAREMGVSIGSLKNLAAEGKITTDVVLKAMQKLKGEQLGKLNAQFGTAEQAMTDFKNAAFDAGVEISKLFGPSVLAGLRVLTGTLKQVNDQMAFYSQMQAERTQYGMTQAQQQKLQIQADEEAQQIVNMRRIPDPFARNEAYQQMRRERMRDLMKRYGYRTGQLTLTPTLTAEELADQKLARQERLKKPGEGAGAGKPPKKPKEYAGNIIEYFTGDPSSKYYDPKDHGGSRYHEHLAFSTTAQRDLAMRALQAEGIRIGSVEGGKHKPTSYHYSRQAFDVPGDQVPVGREPGLSARVRRILASAGFTGKGMEGLATSKTFGESVGDIAIKELEKAQQLAKQRAEDQANAAEQTRQERYEATQLREELDLQRNIRTATTEEQKLSAQAAMDEFRTYQDLTQQIEKMVDPAAMLQRINAVDAEVAANRLQLEKDLAQIRTEEAAARAAETWQESQVTLQATLTDYYQQQNDLLQEQNTIATTLAQSIGQGLSQAFNLAIQGTENWGASLSQIASGVLQDIAQQLIQIAVITPIINAIGNIGASAISPISPGINALPGGDLTGGDFMNAAATGFGFTPSQGMSFGGPLPAASYNFATGGIMTPAGPMPLRRYASGGVATAPQAAIYGEGSMPEAFVPLPDGRRIPVALRQYPGIPGGPGTGQFEQTDAVVQRLVEGARMESSARAASAAAAGPDSTMRIRIETTRINQVDYVTADQAQAIATAAATRSTARQQRALQASPAARRSVGV